jgi:hypothetical protein
MGAKMRQQRHTTAYAPSWQASGNRAAPHRHSSEINRQAAAARRFILHAVLEFPPRPIDQKVFQDKPPLSAVQRPAAVMAFCPAM